MNKGIIFHGKKDTGQQSCAFPGICVLPSGRWLASCRAAPSKTENTGQHVLLSWSEDEGRTWSEQASPFIPAPVAGRPGLFRGAYLTSLGDNRVLAALVWVDYSNPELPFFNEETEGLLDTRIFLAESEDGGNTWSAPKMMDTSPFRVPTPLTGPVLVLRNGEWACQFELNKHYYDPAVWRHSSVLMFSRDEGRTWSEYVITSYDPENRIFYWDQRPAVLLDGRILDLFWTYDNKAAVYRNIQARQSFDNGRNWSEMWDTGVPGQPAQPVSLPDGRVAMVYVDRTGLPAIKLRVSEDGGRTWPAPEHTIYQARGRIQTRKKDSMQDAWAEMGKFSVGLPATASLPNGDTLVVFYAGPSPDCTDIRWVHINGTNLKAGR